MKNIKTVHLVYFSGTGGTARVAKCFEKSFINHKIEVHKTELNTKAYKEIKSDLLVIFFPVYALNAPKPVDEWIAEAPEGNGKPAVVISVSGGGDITPNTACRVDVVKQLEKKNYYICYESMLVMPSNFIVSYDEAISAMILKATPHKSEKIVSDILAGKENRPKPHFIDRLFSKLGSFEKKYGNSFGKKLKVNDNCSGCSWCANHCPRGNISMQEGKPVFGNKCIVCLKCIYGCPQKAIVPGMGKSIVLKEGYDLKAVESRTNHLTEFPPVTKIAKGILLKGVRKYLNENT